MASEPVDLDFLTRWYADHCDGDWEHEFGVRISTLDNPGWHIQVDLTDTELEGRVLPRFRRDLAEGGWLGAASTGLLFEASCDPLSLPLAAAEFRRFAVG